MKLALIYPPYYHKEYNENLKVVDHEFGIFPYISFGYVALAAKKVGWEVKLFDCAARKWTLHQLRHELELFSPNLLCFAAHAVQSFPDLLDWANEIKKWLLAPSLVGGYEAKNYPQEIMSHSCFDFLCAGEASPFLEIFLQAFASKTTYQHVPNLYYREMGEVKYTFLEKDCDFSMFEIPDRSIFDHSLYYSHVSQHAPFTIGMSSVGCPHSCKFCCMRHTAYQARSHLQIADEISDCYFNYGIKEIDWFDPVMLENKKRIYRLANELKARGITINWSARSRIESLCLPHSYAPDVDFIKQLVAMGCKRLFIGIESGNLDVQEYIEKRIASDRLYEVIKCARDNGIMILGFFMIGNPGETEQTVKDTVRLAKSLPLFYAQFSMTIMKPHTVLAQEYMYQAMKCDYWQEIMKGVRQVRALPTPWTKLTRYQQERLAKRAYIAFYFRPFYILKMFGRIKSMNELLRYAKVAMQMFFMPLETKKVKGKNGK